MLYMNKVILAGVVCNTPTLRQNGKGKNVTNFTLKTVEKWKDREGNLKNFSKYHKIVAWGKEAERVTSFVKKDMIVLVEGCLNYHRSQDGDDSKKIAEVKASDVKYKGFYNYKKNNKNSETVKPKVIEVAEEVCSEEAVS